MKRILILLLVVVNLNASFAREIHLGVENSWPPYSDSEGRGISADIIIAAFKEVGVKVHLHVYPYTRVLEMTKRGELDGGFNIPINKDTSDQFVFGEEPILETTVSYYYLAGMPYKDRLVEGDKIALMRGFQYGDIFEQSKSKYDETRVNSQEQMLKLLLRNRVNVVILADGSARYHINKLNLKNKIKKGAAQMNLKVYLGLSKAKKDSRHFAHLLDKGIRILKEKGLYERLLVEEKKGQESLAHVP